VKTPRRGAPSLSAKDQLQKFTLMRAPMTERKLPGLFTIAMLVLAIGVPHVYVRDCHAE
jgi:hypothetical protein